MLTESGNFLTKELLSDACVSGWIWAAAVKLASGQMPVVQAILNGRCFIGLVDTGSAQTLVSLQVVVGQGLRLGKPLLTADGSVSHVSGTSRIVVRLQGHCFSVTALGYE